MKIRTKLQIRFFGIAFLLALSLMSIVYSSMVTHFKQQEGDRLKNNVIQSANAIDKFMFTRVKDLNILSNNPLFSINSSETISEYLLQVVEQYPFYEYISFVDKDAIVKASSSQEMIGLNIIVEEPDIEKEFYQALKGGNNDVFISDIAKVSQKEINKNAPLDIELLSNVIDLNGNVIGVLLGSVNIQLIKDIVSDLEKRTIGDEYAYLVNHSGDIVITANPEIVILNPHPDLEIKNLRQKLENEENGYTIYKNSKGKKVISGYADLSEYGTENIGNWSLISTSPYNTIMLPIYGMLYKVLFAFSFILVGIFLLTVRFSRTLSKPIIELQNAVSKFEMESKPLELKIGEIDEVGNLSKSFNAMSKKIYTASEERKKIEKLLYESKNYLDNIINNIGDPVFVKDDQSRLLIVNDAFCKIFNLSKPDIIGFTLAENVTEKERESFLKIDRQVLADGIENTNEETLTVLGGETQYISTKKSRFIDNKNNKFLIGIIRNITEKKQKELEITKLNDTLEQRVKARTIQLEMANKDLEAFSYSVSHDLRSPLRHIDGFASLLKISLKDKLDKKEENYFKHIINSTFHMNQLIDGLLNYSGTGRAGLKKENLNMQALINKVIQTFVFDIENKKISIIVDSMPDAFADQMLMKQVWENLISNAIKFTSKTKKPTIHIGYEKDINENIIYFIKDNGAGFNQEYVNKVFGVFQRLHSINDFPGTGIGLATTRLIILKHDGEIWAEGIENIGASFFIKLPVN